jgi:hypothetical protein
MKIFWLTPGQLAGAFVIGLSIVLALMYATVPHPVEVPVQIITPVPTPPPVVITEQPININLPTRNTQGDILAYPFTNDVDMVIMTDIIVQMVKISVLMMVFAVVFGIIASVIGGQRDRRL